MEIFWLGVQPVPQQAPINVAHSRRASDTAHEPCATAPVQVQVTRSHLEDGIEKLLVLQTCLSDQVSSLIREYTQGLHAARGHVRHVASEILEGSAVAFCNTEMRNHGKA